MILSSVEIIFMKGALTQLASPKSILEKAVYKLKWLQKADVIIYSFMVFHFHEKRLPRIRHDLVTIRNWEGVSLFINCS